MSTLAKSRGFIHHSAGHDPTTYDIGPSSTETGHVTSLTYGSPAQYSFSQIGYDLQDRMTSYSAPGVTGATLAYDDLGEITFAGGAFSESNSYNVGVLASNRTAAGPKPSSITYTVDLANGRTAGSSSDSGQSCPNSYLRFNNGYHFDSAGRLTSGSRTILFSAYSRGGCSDAHGSGSFSANFDNENHLISKNLANWSDGTYPTGGTVSLTWGLSGHPEVATRSNLADAHQWYWDGDNLLFEYSPTTFCSYIETFAQCGHVIDRDIAGQVVSEHTDLGYGPFQDSGAFPVSINPELAILFYINGLTYLRRDGLTFSPGSSEEGITIQGTREYNSGIAQWTTPDAYEGRVDDPMSQRPYVYNRNNPEQYEDPSGYNPEDEERELPETASEGYRAVEDGVIDRALDAVFGEEGAGLGNKLDPKSFGHLFGTRIGHIPDTPLNREILRRTANDPGASEGTDAHGRTWFQHRLPSGSYSWAEVLNGNIRNGGINETPRSFDPITGLKDPDPPITRSQASRTDP